MVETGFFVPYWLSAPAVLLPFFTAIVILFRKSFREDSLTLLMLLALLLCIKNILFLIAAESAIYNAVFMSLFTTGEFILLFLLCREALRNLRMKEWMNYFLVALLSTTFTLHFTQLDNSYVRILDIVQGACLIALSLGALLLLIRKHYLVIFYSPLFWIAGGTLFYYTMQVATELLAENSFLSAINEGEKKTLLAVFDLMRIIFYLIASLVPRPLTGEDSSAFSKKSFPEYPLQ